MGCRWYKGSYSWIIEFSVLEVSTPSLQHLYANTSTSPLYPPRGFPIFRFMFPAFLVHPFSIAKHILRRHIGHNHH